MRSEFPDGDYLIVVDCDDVNVAPIELVGVRSAIELLHHNASYAAVFANSLPHYYDMWALRHPQRGPADIWEAVADEVVNQGVSDEDAFNRMFRSQIFSLSRDEPLLEVDSAFGRLGIYKLPSVLRNTRSFGLLAESSGLSGRSVA